VSDATDRASSRGDLDVEELAQAAARNRRNGLPYDKAALNRRPVFFTPASCDSETADGRHACNFDDGHHEDFHIAMYPGGSATYWKDNGETWEV